MKVRVYFPIGSEYYMESPWVEVNGKRSFEPTTDQPQLKLADVVKEAVQKRTAVIDNSMSMQSQYNVKVAAAASGDKMPTDLIDPKECNQLELTLLATGAGAVARIGMAPASVNLGIFGTSSAVSENMTVGGTYGAATLEVIGRLAHYSFLEITRLHFEASAEAFFAVTPKLRVIDHTGTCKKEENVHYPKASAEDDNTDIRTIDEKYIADKNLDFVLDGKNYLEIPVPNGESANVTLYTCFYPKKG